MFRMLSDRTTKGVVQLRRSYRAERDSEQERFVCHSLSSFLMYFRAKVRPESFRSTILTFPKAPFPTTRRRRKWLRLTVTCHGQLRQRGMDGMGGISEPSSVDTTGFPCALPICARLGAPAEQSLYRISYSKDSLLVVTNWPSRPTLARCVVAWSLTRVRSSELQGRFNG